MAAPERPRRSAADSGPSDDSGTPAETGGFAGTGEFAGAGEFAGVPDALSYEQARDELGDLVRQLESGGTGLEESLRLWERGEYLVGVCQQWLDGARVRLERAGTDRP